MTRPDVARRPNDEPSMNDAEPSDPEKKVDILTRELGEAREQQTAISQMLQVISRRTSVTCFCMRETRSASLSSTMRRPPTPNGGARILYLWLMLIRTIHSPV